MTSHMTMPKLHTSLAEVNFLYAMASGAVQRIGILPPCAGEKSVDVLMATATSFLPGIFRLPRYTSPNSPAGRKETPSMGRLIEDGDVGPR
ncbi:hypothetical protein EYF80_040881 [Liparis tanakae]|uniref:Uncharacterized protein n=1 Tax=Liparis tanakae TaxID=230148 RepID=A0A4Z2G5U4_9TELE|nr:hypothetical protein EYF80_040881 [Liparis tanakae]